MNHGTLFIVSAPSGAGKTSLVRQLQASLDGFTVSISHTTRPKRVGETHGADYYFVDHAEFERMIAEGAFLEHAKVFDQYYGTARATVEAALASGRDVLLEIDWQGARQVKALMPESQSLFILPPSREALETRLRGRGQDDEATIARRMRDATAEMSHYAEYDYLIVNDRFERALEEMRSIVIARRLRTPRMAARLADLLDHLLGCDR